MFDRPPAAIPSVLLLIQFFPALDLGLVDEGESGVHKGGGERTEDGGWKMYFYFGRERGKWVTQWEVRFVRLDSLSPN